MEAEDDDPKYAHSWIISNSCSLGGPLSIIKAAKLVPETDTTV